MPYFQKSHLSTTYVTRFDGLPSRDIYHFYSYSEYSFLDVIKFAFVGTTVMVAGGAQLTSPLVCSRNLVVRKIGPSKSHQLV